LAPGQDPPIVGAEGDRAHPVVVAEGPDDFPARRNLEAPRGVVDATDDEATVRAERRREVLEHLAK
jgi:hypothetical protein